MSEMDRDEFDEVLASALRRVDAPEGFAASVMERAGVEEHKAVRAKARIFVFPKLPVWATGSIAAGLIVGALAFGGVHVRHEQQRVQAQREFETASRITDRALEHAREQLAKAGVSLEE